jgi:hypothetical protein
MATARTGNTGPLLAALAAALGGVACPVPFVEPNPPELELFTRSYLPPTVDEPVFFAVVFDVHLSVTTECDALKARIRQAARDIFLPPGSPGAELPFMDLTPTCRQELDRGMDVSTMETAIIAQEAIWGRRRVRPILLYVNNVDLGVPNGFKSNLIQLRFSADQRGSPRPLLWGLVMPRARQDTSFDRTSSWSHASSPGLLAGINSIARGDLPLVSAGSSPPGGVPLFTEAELARVRQFRGCPPQDSRLQGINFMLNAGTVTVDLARPPRFQFSAGATQPTPRSTFDFNPVSFRVEGCSANCDRFHRMPDGRLEIWNRLLSCVLVENPSGTLE